MEQSEVAKARAAIHGLVQRGARKQQRELYPLRAAEPRKLQADQSVYEQLEEEGWGRAPAAVPVGFAVGNGKDSHDDDDGADRTKRKRPDNKGADIEEDEDEEEDNDENDRSTLSKAGGNAGIGIRGGRPGNLTTWELNHFKRRHFLLPQSAWPILPSASPVPPLPATAGSVQEEGGVCRPPPEALPEGLAIDGVRHFVPRVRVSGGARKRKNNNKRAFEPAETHLEWLPFENVVVEPGRKEMDGYPVPSPVLARVLDAALVRQLVGVVQAPRKGEEEEDMDEEEDKEEEEDGEKDREMKKKPMGVCLYDLLQSALGRLGEEEVEEEEAEDDDDDDDDDDEKKQRRQSRQQERAEAVQLLRQCLGREVERMVDVLLGHVLAYWSERSQAQRSEEGYLAWLRRQRACHTSNPKKGRSLEDRMGFANQNLVLGDWHDVLGAVEERVAVDAAAAKGRREERRRVEEGIHKEAKRQVKDKVKCYARSGVKMVREHDRKVRERLDEAEDEEEEEEEEGREEEGEVNVLMSALDAGTLGRSRARLERLFWAGKGALPPEGGL